MMQEESIKLSYQEGSSDKVYEAELKDEGNGWIVVFAYGRRGNTLTMGMKTKSPVGYEVAKKEYDKLVKSKIAKGYNPEGEISGTINVVQKEDLGLRPQLLNEIDITDINKYIVDDNYCMQEKFDGRRRMLTNQNGDVFGANKKGFKVALSASIEKACHNVIGGIGTLDGEDMGDQIMIFDDLTDPTRPYYKRHKTAEVKLKYNQHLIVVETAWTAITKRQMYERLVANKAEGAVFKLIDAPYTPGRPASGGSQFKYKFYATASCIVQSVSDIKSSIALCVFDNGDVVNVGNATVYPNMEMPQVGDVVEIKYLYFYPGGSLYQPVLLGVRDDVTVAECLIKQLKLKQETV